MSKVTEAWDELEKVVREELPGILDDFDAKYEAPKYKSSPGPGSPDVCSVCGAEVGSKKAHSRWHRALSMRIFIDSSFTMILHMLSEEGEG